MSDNINKQSQQSKPFLSTIPEWAKTPKTKEEARNAPHHTILPQASAQHKSPEAIHQDLGRARQEASLHGLEEMGSDIAQYVREHDTEGKTKLSEPDRMEGAGRPIHEGRVKVNPEKKMGITESVWVTKARERKLMQGRDVDEKGVAESGEH